MKCPVCEAEISEFSLCPTCGFDPGRDYEAYPSLTPLEGAKPLSVLRADWQRKDRDLLRCPGCGGRTFSFHSGERSVICASCGRPLERDVLSPFFSQSTPEKAHSVIQDPSLPFSYDDGTRTLTVRGQGPMKKYLSGRTPWSAFRSVIQHIVIEKDVTTICAKAFANYPELLTVSLPEGLTRIEKNAFSGCSKLESIVFPESLSEIGSYAFERCSSLEEIILPSGVSTLANGAFYECSSLTSVTILSVWINIGDWAFWACPLQQILYSGTKKNWNLMLSYRLSTADLDHVSVSFDYRKSS